MVSQNVVVLKLNLEMLERLKNPLVGHVQEQFHFISRYRSYLEVIKKGRYHFCYLSTVFVRIFAYIEVFKNIWRSEYNTLVL